MPTRSERTGRHIPLGGGEAGCTQSERATIDRYRWLFLANAIFVVLASLPLLLAYPRVFAALGIPSLENGFFVQLAAGWLFAERVASFLVWQRLRGNDDLLRVIVTMKAIFIALVVAASVSGSLPERGFLVGDAIDLAFSLAFATYLRADGSRSP
jgi:hypothetical protein